MSNASASVLNLKDLVLFDAQSANNKENSDFWLINSPLAAPLLLSRSMYICLMMKKEVYMYVVHILGPITSHCDAPIGASQCALS